MPVSTQGSLLGGRYRVLRHLGSGGMASVLLCQDERLDRLVAVKRLHADSPADVERRFAREAKLGASLNHPNLVSVFDTATDDEGVLIVMEYVEGEALAGALRRGPLGRERVAAMVRDLGEALDHAHAQGVVHRDVKPGNVLLRRDGVTKLVDLGIATAADQTRITRSGMVLGTAAYMAPEQLEGGETTGATDVYALAVVAYEALAGERPHGGRTPMQIAHEIASGPPRDLREDLPDAAPAAAAALKRAMARDPAERPSSAGAFARELAPAIAESETAPTRAVARTADQAPVPPTAAGAAHSDGPAPTPARPARSAPPFGRRGRARRPIGAIVLALVLLALAAAAVIGAVVSAGGDGDGQGSADSRQQPPGGDAKKDKPKGKATKAKKAKDEPPAQAAPAPQQPPAQAEQSPRQEAPAAGGQARGSELNDHGYALIQRGDYAGAVPILQQAVASWPEDSRDIEYAYALFNLGQALNRSGRPNDAIPYLEKRLTFDDQRGRVQAELDLARRNAGQG